MSLQNAILTVGSSKKRHIGLFVLKKKKGLRRLTPEARCGVFA